jgi:uncharacterized protein
MKQTGAAAARPQEPSMEEILASIRRIIADDGEPEPPEPPRPVRAAPAAALPTLELQERDEGLDPAARAASVRPAATMPAPVREGTPVGDGTEETTDVNAVHDTEPAPPPHSKEPQRTGPSPEALLSGEADAHVSRAFNRLATTVLTNNARTLEDLVKDLLRPMLKAWLDDNLPPLVERLVRAEIERVARGGG